jgi:hypothetical protein
LGNLPNYWREHQDISRLKEIYRGFLMVILWTYALFDWLKNHGWKYCSLICYERKTLYHGW